jgi:uncharacterized protein with ParB-like and HNH nuclease domain
MLKNAEAVNMGKDVIIEEIPPEEDDYYSNDDIFNISSWGADLSFRELITMYKEGELAKPELQRYYVWDKIEASRFIESLLLGLPVPSIFLARGKREQKLIIDGYQRIMTVFDYVTGIFSKDNKVFKLSDTKKINERWRGKAFSELEEHDQRRINSSTIHAIIFEQKHPKDSDTSLYQIFERINTTGRTLMTQEIRNCAYQGALNTLLFELNKDAKWRELFGSIDVDNRMRDIEFILRFIALSETNLGELQQKQKMISMKEFLNQFMGSKAAHDTNNLNNWKENFISTIHYIHENIGIHAFHNLTKDKTGYANRFHPTVFDAISCATFAVLKNTPKIKATNLESKRIELLKTEEFADLIYVRTTNVDRICSRINMAKRYLFGV